MLVLEDVALVLIELIVVFQDESAVLAVLLVDVGDLVLQETVLDIMLLEILTLLGVQVLHTI